MTKEPWDHRLLRPLSSNLILDVNSKVTWRLSWPQRPPGAVRSIMHMDIRAVRAAKGPFIKDFARGGLKSLKILQINTTDRLHEKGEWPKIPKFLHEWSHIAFNSDLVK